MQNKTLVAVREDGDILTWNTENWESTNQLKEAEDFRESRIALGWNNLLAFSFGSKISVWKEETGQSLNKSNNFNEEVYKLLKIKIMFLLLRPYNFIKS